MDRLETRRHRVTHDPTGFSVGEPGQQLVRVEWQNVVEIFAFKYDLWSYDEIVLGFRLAGESDAFVEVSEEAQGYAELMVEMEARFPGFRTNCFADVAFPAFVENRTTLWERSSIS